MRSLVQIQLPRLMQNYQEKDENPTTIRPVTFTNKTPIHSFGEVRHWYEVTVDDKALICSVGKDVHEQLQKILTDVPKTVKMMKMDGRLLERIAMIELPTPEQVIELVDGPLGIVNEQPKQQELGPVLYKLYKLRRKSDNLYSTGGRHVGWSQKGKVWSTLAALSGHLAQHTGDVYNAHYTYNYNYGAGSSERKMTNGTSWDDLEIVVLEVRENETDRKDANEYIQGLRQRREKREAQQKLAAEKRKMENAKKELTAAEKRVEELKTKYGF